MNQLKNNQEVQNTSSFDDLRNLYTMALKEISKILKETQASTPMQMYATYNHLLKEGYLSECHMFLCGKPSVSIPSLEGINIFRGKGSSLEMSMVLKDLLNYNTYTSEMVGMISPPSPPVTLDSFSAPTEPMKNKFHLFHKYDYYSTLVLEKNGSYLLNPYQDSLFMIGQRRNICRVGQDPITEELFCYDESLKSSYESTMLKCSTDQVSTLVKEYTDQRDKCMEYMDLFEHFFKEKVGLFREISTKAMTYKTKRKRLLT